MPRLIVPKKDFAQLAFSVVQGATSGGTREAAKAKGKAGGKARAKALTKNKRAEIARIAAAARWKKNR